MGSLERLALSIVTFQQRPNDTLVRTNVFVADSLRKAADDILSLLPASADVRLLHPVSEAFTNDVLRATIDTPATDSLETRLSQIRELLRRTLHVEIARIEGDD